MKKFLFFISMIGLLFFFQSCNTDTDLIDTTNSEKESFYTILDSLDHEEGMLENWSSTFRYKISMTGKTFGSYNFQRAADMIVVKGIKAAGSKNINNGVNPYDVGIKSGSPAANPVIGSIWYGTNTAMCSYMNIGCSILPANASLDLSYVKWLNSKTMQIDLDGRYFNNAASGASLLGFLNIFNATTGITSKAFRIISGRIIITFESNGTVKGNINISGSSLSGAAQVSYIATFSGKKA
jgi:hypothetical protein